MGEGGRRGEGRDKGNDGGRERGGVEMKEDEKGGREG